MRPVRIIAAVVLTAAVAATGSYIARSTADHPAAAPAAPVAAVPTAPPASPRASAPAGQSDATTSQPVALADGRHPVYLKTVEPYQQRITFDLVQWYGGADAAREAAKDHLEADNDYYIRNTSSRLRTLPVLAAATITVNQLTGSNHAVPVSLAKLSTWFPRTGPGPMFWITVRDGHVSQITEQWVP
jgi:nucleoid-associated protein YgaU